MSFTLDLCKQAQKVIFFGKFHKSAHPPLGFINSAVSRTVPQKQLGLLLNSKLDFQEYLKITVKVTRWVSLKKLCQDLP